MTHALMILAIALGAPSVEFPKGALAVTSIEPKQGVSKDTAELLTDRLSDVLRKTERFTRVISAKDVNAALTFEAQRQTLDCTDTSCIAEIAGAMGVEYLISGSLGRVGDVWVLNLRLISSRNAAVMASVSRSLEGAKEGDLVAEVDRAVDELLGIKAAGAQVVAEPVKTRGPLVLPLRVGGGVGAGLAAGAVLVAVLVAAVAGGTAAGTWLYVDTVNNTHTYYPQLRVLYYGALVVTGVGAALVPLAALVLAAGAGALAASMVMP